MRTFPLVRLSSLQVSRTIYWVKKGSFTVLDQGLFAGGNFLINILLARWLEPAQYGAFAVAFSVFLLIAAIHGAILTEPMMIFGTGKYAEKFRKYLGILIYGHWVITGTVSVTLVVIAIIFWQLGSKNTAEALAGLSIASPLILQFWHVRKGFYTQLSAQWAMIGSVVYLILMLTFAFGLMKTDLLSPGSVLIAMGFAGLISSIGLLIIMRPQLRFTGTNPTPTMILRDHWEYGSWNVLAQGLHWSSGQILIVLVPMFLGLQASAVIAAVLNLFRPLHLLMHSTYLLIIPAFSALANKGEINKNSLTNYAKRFLLLFAGGFFVYGMLMFAFSDFALHYLYAGKYDGYSSLVFLFALSYTASATVHVFTVILRSIGKVRETVFVWGLSALITLLLSIPILLLGSLHGVILLFTCSYLIAAVAAWRRLLNYRSTE